MEVSAYCVKKNLRNIFILNVSSVSMYYLLYASPLRNVLFICKASILLCLLRRKIRLREGNAKCRHLNKLTCKGILRHVFFCLRPKTPYGTVYREGGGRGVENIPERRGEGQHLTKLCRKYQHDWLYLPAICYLRINHNAQIFLTRPSVWSCEGHGCHPLEKIPAAEQ